VVGGVPVNATFLTLATTVEMKLLGKHARDGASVTDVVLGKLKSELPRIMATSLCFWCVVLRYTCAGISCAFCCSRFYDALFECMMCVCVWGGSLVKSPTH
jgi:hypothetical protein